MPQSAVAVAGSTLRKDTLFSLIAKEAKAQV
jgi:hypothetical protein